MSTSDYMDQAAALLDAGINANVEAGKRQIRGERAATGRRLKTIRAQLPLIKARYANLLAEIRRSEAGARADINRSQENQLGNIVAQSASRGSYGGSVENSALTNARTEFAGMLSKLISDMAAQKRAGLLERNTSEQGVRESLSSVRGDFERRRGDLYSRIGDIIAKGNENKVNLATTLSNIAEEKARWEAEQARRQREFDAEMNARAADRAAANARAYAQMALERERYRQSSNTQNLANEQQWARELAKGGRKNALNDFYRAKGIMSREGVDPQGVLERLLFKYPSYPAHEVQWPHSGVAHKPANPTPLRPWYERFSDPISYWSQ